MPIQTDANKLLQFKKNYWNYYLELENQFLETKKYVAFDSANFKTYSMIHVSKQQSRESTQAFRVHLFCILCYFRSMSGEFCPIRRHFLPLFYAFSAVWA